MNSNIEHTNQSSLDFLDSSDSSNTLHKRLRSIFVLSIMQGLLLLGLLIIIGIGIYFIVFKSGNGENGSFYSTASNSSCNVQVVNITGPLTTSEYIDPATGASLINSTEIITKLSDANNDNRIEAVVLNIDTPGGSPVAGWDILYAAKMMNKPVVSWIRSEGASAGYLAAIGGDRVFADDNSLVGSIGATSSYVDYSVKNKQEGLVFNELASGKFKDLGNPDKPLTAEERTLILRDVTAVRDNFVRTVSEERHLEESKVASLADGSAVLGKAALAEGLIDELGGLPEVEQYLQKSLSKPALLCWK